MLKQNGSWLEFNIIEYVKCNYLNFRITECAIMINRRFLSIFLSPACLKSKSHMSYMFFLRRIISMEFLEWFRHYHTPKIQLCRWKTEQLYCEQLLTLRLFIATISFFEHKALWPVVFWKSKMISNHLYLDFPEFTQVRKNKTELFIQDPHSATPLSIYSYF